MDSNTSAIAALKRELNDLERQRRELNDRIIKTRQALELLEEPPTKGDIVAVAKEHGMGKRLKHSVLKHMRAEAGQTIYEYLAENKGKQYQRGKLEIFISRGYEHQWPEIISEWNARHPKTPIKHNGGSGNTRRYHA